MRSPSPEPSPFVPDEASRTGESPLLAAGHLDAWWCWSAVGLALIFGAVAATAAALRHPLRPGLTAVALLAAAVGVIGFMVQFARRQWLTWTDDSICLRSRGATIEILDSDIASLAMTREYRHAVGRIVAVSHRLRLWTGGSAPQVITVETRGRPGDPAPFEALASRLQTQLQRRALNTLRRDAVLHQPDWSWEAGQLSIRVGGRPVRLGVSDISAVDNGETELRIWVGADPLPVVKIRQLGQDVWLLGRMLEATAGAPGDDDVAPATGLGRILHESRPRSAAILATMLCGLSATVALLAIAGAVALRLTPLAILGAGTGIGALMLGSTARRLWQCAFRLHEAGISQRSLTGDRALRFEEIDQFVFDARRQYSKGRYLGTLFTMVFASEQQPKQGILHSERSAYETDQIAGIRDRVAEEIAAEMASKLTATGELLWTRELTIQGRVLHCRPRRFLRRAGAPIGVPLGEISRYEVSEGWLFVWSSERSRPLVRVRTAEANFYPGLLVFEQLLEEATTTAASRAPGR